MKVANKLEMKELISSSKINPPGTYVRLRDLAVPRMGRTYAGITKVWRLRSVVSSRICMYAE